MATSHYDKARMQEFPTAYKHPGLSERMCLTFGPRNNNNGQHFVQKKKCTVKIELGERYDSHWRQAYANATHPPQSDQGWQAILWFFLRHIQAVVHKTVSAMPWPECVIRVYELASAGSWRGTPRRPDTKQHRAGKWRLNDANEITSLSKTWCIRARHLKNRIKRPLR